MNKLKQLWRIATHPKELRLTLSGLGLRLGGDEALGGLTSEERAALVRWVNAADRDAKRQTSNVKLMFVEIGTLFGLTAKTIAQQTSAKVVAVDLFCWNPFGLTPEQHESFTRDILAGTGVELVKDDAQHFLSSNVKPQTSNVEPVFVFLDGDHRYEAVKAELEILKKQGVKYLAGHDFGNSRFGVTAAVREVLGEPDEVAGMVWYKKV